MSSIKSSARIGIIVAPFLPPPQRGNTTLPTFVPVVVGPAAPGDVFLVDDPLAVSPMLPSNELLKVLSPVAVAVGPPGNVVVEVTPLDVVGVALAGTLPPPADALQ